MAASLLPLSLPQTPKYHYRPHISSPLSMRSPNTCALSSSPTPHSPQYFKSASKPPPRRPTPKNSPPNRLTTRDRESESAKRRVNLLRQGKERRERKSWASREEQILQSDYREQQRRWEEEQVRAMQAVTAGVEDAEASSSPIIPPTTRTEFDQMMLSQEAELEAMYANWSDAKQQDQDLMDERDDMTTEYGSEDAEYDELLVGLAAEAERENGGTDPGQDMDMEMG